MKDNFRVGYDMPESNHGSDRTFRINDVQENDSKKYTYESKNKGNDFRRTDVASDVASKTDTSYTSYLANGGKFIAEKTESSVEKEFSDNDDVASETVGAGLKGVRTSSKNTEEVIKIAKQIKENNEIKNVIKNDFENGAYSFQDTGAGNVHYGKTKKNARNSRATQGAGTRSSNNSRPSQSQVPPQQLQNSAGAKTAEQGVSEAGKGVGKEVGKEAGKAVASGATKTATATAGTAAAPVSLIIILVIALIICILFCILFCITFIKGITALFNSSIFLSIDSDTETSENTEVTVDENEWIRGKIELRRNEIVEEIKEIYNANSVSNGGDYHYVKFYDNIAGEEIVLNEENIETSLYSVEEYKDFIQPVFHVLLLSEYEYSVSESEMESIFEEIWISLTGIKTEALPTEYCYMEKLENEDGTYTITPILATDGNIWADVTGEDTGIVCLNHSEELYHASNVSPLNSCDARWWMCLGHRKQIGTSSLKSYCTVGKMSYACSNSELHFICNGYYICNGHNTLTVSVELSEFDSLMNKYFLDEIQELEEKAELTEEEEGRLNDLNGYYELCLMYKEMLENQVESE